MVKKRQECRDSQDKCDRVVTEYQGDQWVRMRAGMGKRAFWMPSEAGGSVDALARVGVL